VFCPEGAEDLDIRDQAGQCVEVIQVKSYSNLALSDLEPEKAGSFFHRAVSLLQAANPPAIKIANFGALGPELRQAWEGSVEHRQRIVAKLAEKGFSQADVEKCFEHIQIVSLDESSEQEAVLSQIQNLAAGIDPLNAFDLFVTWYDQLAERRQTVECAALVEKINQVGRFLAERYHYHQQWYTTIAPLEAHSIADDQLPRLRAEFYAGVQARYEHILSGLDFRRDHKVTEIARAFQEHRVVIVHAASGQGKSTLAYRYLHDAYPEKWRFAVRRVQDVEHALSIAQALSGFADAVQVPIAVYVDVHPRDSEWPELVKQLIRQPYLDVLVTIREEDYRRASISDAGFDFTDIELEFDQEEAHRIYERARETGEGRDFLDFDAAWEAFGGEGPLMEFVYLLTQTQTLRQRLQGQVQRIEEEVRMGASADELRLLCMVSVASAYGAQLRTHDLIQTLSLPAPDRTLAQFEREYLLRRSADGHYLEGLHPIRSEILSDLLVKPDINPWLDVATQVLPLMPEEDLETFILHALVARPADYTQLLDRVVAHKPKTWSGVAGILRCLLWAGAKDYVDANRLVMEEAHEALGPAWWFAVDLNFLSPGEGPSLDEWWTTLGDMIPPERQERIRAIRRSQTPKDAVFSRATDWLQRLVDRPTVPSEPDAWGDVAEVWYWAARLAPQKQMTDWISDETLSATIEHLPLTTIADLSLALHLCDPARHSRWLDTHIALLHSRLADEYEVLALEKIGTTLKIHFVPSGKASSDSDPLHAETIDRIGLVRRLFPGYERYGAQGYGFKPAGIELPQGDSTYKEGIPSDLLLPEWGTWLNGLASGLAHSCYRPDTWERYLDSMIKARELVVDCLSSLNRGLMRYYQRDKPINVLERIDFQEWLHGSDVLGGMPDLPKSAVDRWGFASESSSASVLQELAQRGHVPNALALQKYRAYLEARREYFSSLQGFFNQAPAVWVTNFYAGKLRPGDPRRKGILNTLEEKQVTANPHLSIYNLFQAKAALAAYQQQFTALFGQHLNADNICTLEQREREVLSTTWTLWYFYAHEPWKSAASRLQQVSNWMVAAQRHLDSQIQQVLVAIQTPTFEAARLDLDHPWQGHPAVWISFDLTDPTELYTKLLEEFPTALRSAIGPVGLEELTYYLIQGTCEYIVIVPLVRGRMLDALVWPFHTLTVLQEENLQAKPWAYFPQPLPDEAGEDLAIETWDIEEIALANQFSQSVATLRQLTSQISEFQAMPDLTEPGGDRLQAYMGDELSKPLSAALQAFFDTGSELLNRFNALSEDEQQKRVKLCEAIGALIEIHDVVKPGEGDGVFQLGLQEIVEYAQRLESVLPISESIRLLWIADVLV